jgi:hypothetical protein
MAECSKRFVVEKPTLLQLKSGRIMPEKPKKGRALLSELHEEESSGPGGKLSAQDPHYI